MSEHHETEIAALRESVAALSSRLHQMEQRLEQEATPSREVLLAIAAACAAYLGKRATVKQVRLRRDPSWVAGGRAAQHRSRPQMREAR